ncbi:MAG: NAD(P)-dependent oxidoreductase [Chloroflexi bacterium]|nr:NAD(P)-dependent oxidoreductase [Chloroflexota bacterium]
MKVAYIGLGTMGSRMVRNLLKAGHDVVVNDVRREAAEPLIGLGARWADSPALAASAAELTLTSLPGPREVEAVSMGESGVLQGIPEGAVYADLSTSSVSLARRIDAAFRERGVHALDAPVSGGPYGAETATLILMVGGDRAVYDRVKPALDAIGNNVTYIGEAGAGAVAKLVHNMIGIASAQLMAEAFTLGVKAGVDPERLLEAVRGGAYGKGMSLSQGVPQVVFKGDFDNPRFALALARKDLGLATELARELGVPMAMAAVAEQGMIEAMNRGFGPKDSSAVWLLQEERTGVQVRTEPNAE